MRNHVFEFQTDSTTILQVVASQDWPEVTKYAGMVSAQACRQEIIRDLFKTWEDPQNGTFNGGMIRCVHEIFETKASYKFETKTLLSFINLLILHYCRELLLSFKQASWTKATKDNILQVLSFKFYIFHNRLLFSLVYTPKKTTKYNTVQERCE